MALGLLQRDVAAALGASKASVHNWERGHADVDVRFIPAIIRFLGYDPIPEPIDGSTGGRLAAARLRLGLSQAALGELLGLDESTVGEVERGVVRRRPYRRVTETIRQFIDDPPSAPEAG